MLCACTRVQLHRSPPRLQFHGLGPSRGDHRVLALMHWPRHVSRSVAQPPLRTGQSTARNACMMHIQAPAAARARNVVRLVTSDQRTEPKLARWGISGHGQGQGRRSAWDGMESAVMAARAACPRRSCFCSRGRNADIPRALRMGPAWKSALLSSPPRPCVCVCSPRSPRWTPTPTPTPSRATAALPSPFASLPNACASC
ncbi:hypothetical protein C8Q78DRAFT_1024020 [Trametes maxima]|nr:hypothetical protein C8Q78DRAFT_1024020 [Trametes maxima]